MGDNPGAADNRWLREAFEDQVPIIYFLGDLAREVSGHRGRRSLPAGMRLLSQLASRSGYQARSARAPSPPSAGMRCAWFKQRLHQASFRDAVITAYQGRCALSGLPEPMLLDAAHIINDSHELFGQPVVPNGIPLSKIHHAAFDSHLIGIDPNFKVHVAERLRAKHDGPMLEALKRLHLTSFHLPGRERDRPDRERLAERFEAFKAAA